MYLRTDDDGKVMNTGIQLWSMICVFVLTLAYVDVFLFSSQYGSITGVYQEPVVIFYRSGVAAPSGGQRGDNRIYTHAVRPWEHQHNTYPQHLIHPH